MFKNLILKIYKNKVLKETSWSFLSKGIAFFFYFLLNIILARSFGPSNFGFLSFFFSIINLFLLFAHFGINISAKKYVAQYSKTKNLKAVILSSLKVRIFFSLVFVLFFLFAHKTLVNLLKRPEFDILFFLSVPFLFFGTIVEYLKEIFQGLHRIKYKFFINLFEYGLKFIFTILFFLFIKKSFAIVINAYTFALLITSCVGLQILYSKFYKNLKSSRMNFKKNILRYSLPLFITNIGFFVSAELNTIMIGLMRDSVEVGIYSVAKEIVVKLPHLAMAISAGAMPVFARLDQNNKKDLRRFFYKLLKINVGIFGTISLVILSTSWFFIPLVYGFGYLKSVLPLILLTPYLFLFSCSVFLSALLDFQGKAGKRARNLVIAIVLNLILNFLLIPRLGASGAALTSSISSIPYVLLNLKEVREILK